MRQFPRSALPFFHLVMSLFVASFLIFTQSFVLAGAENPWLWVDLIAVYVFYVGLEHHTFSAIFKILLVSVIFEINSAVPAGFCLMSHLLIMLVGNRLAVWLEMQQRLTQLVLFAFLMAIKEALFAGTLRAIGLEIELGPYLAHRLPGLLVTILIAIPLMELLSWLDSRFESPSIVPLRSGFSHS